MAVAEFVELVAVMVNGVAESGAVGVPEINPDVVSKVSPAGSAGLISKLAIFPPVEEMV